MGLSFHKRFYDDSLIIASLLNGIYESSLEGILRRIKVFESFSYNAL